MWREEYRTASRNLLCRDVEEERLGSASGFRLQASDQVVGFHRRTGLRAAAVSSRRETRVECGAVLTSSGSPSTSWAIERIASRNKSSSSFDSLSVGSIIMAPGTISGNAVV